MMGGASDPPVVRLALVNVPDDVLRPLLPVFNAASGLRGEIVYTGNDPFAIARDGKADLVISHYGHAGVEPFVTSGFGLWPHAVFANQMALLGPPSDPAGVRGVHDAAEALRKIATTHSRFLVNNSDGAKYIEEILWTSAGVQPNGNWYVNQQSRGPQAVRDAARESAYVIFGVPPFLRIKTREPINLEALVVADPIFQRIMVAIVVNAKRVPNVNTAGAEAFQKFLIAPSTQARVRSFRYPGFDQQVWWPAGRHNQAQD